MADYVRLTGTPYYIGAAGDTKPTNCPSGSRCYEHDTQKWYITYDGGSNWPEIDDSVPNIQAIADVEGTTSGAKVITDANGTIQQYLRGLVALAVSGINTTPAGWTISGEQATGTNTIKSSAGILHGFFIETDGDNDVTVQFYNHASGATSPITPSIVLPATDRFVAIMDVDANCTVGITEIHSGTNGIVTVLYL